MQSKRLSLYESLANTFSGTLINIGVTQLVMHRLGYPITMVENLGITVLMTAISVARGYTVRRIFNKIRK